MASPVSSDLANHAPITNQTAQRICAGRTWFPILRGDPSLPKEQRNLVRTTNLFGLSLCIAGLVLFGVSIPISEDSGSDSKLMDPNYRAISSLRFPCLILGTSALYFAKLTTTYFKKTNETQNEISPKFMQEIEEQVKKHTVNAFNKGTYDLSIKCAVCNNRHAASSTRRAASPTKRYLE